MTWFVNYGEVGESGPTAPTIEQREDQVVPTANQLAGQPHEVWRVRLPFCDSAAGFARPLDGLYHLTESHNIRWGRSLSRDAQRCVSEDESVPGR